MAIDYKKLIKSLEGMKDLFGKATSTADSMDMAIAKASSGAAPSSAKEWGSWSKKFEKLGEPDFANEAKKRQLQAKAAGGDGLAGMQLEKMEAKEAQDRKKGIFGAGEDFGNSIDPRERDKKGKLTGGWKKGGLFSPGKTNMEGVGDAVSGAGSMVSKAGDYLPGEAGAAAKITGAILQVGGAVLNVGGKIDGWVKQQLQSTFENYGQSAAMSRVALAFDQGHAQREIQKGDQLAGAAAIASEARAFSDRAWAPTEVAWERLKMSAGTIWDVGRGMTGKAFNDAVGITAFNNVVDMISGESAEDREKRSTTVDLVQWGLDSTGWITNYGIPGDFNN
jgi:hypothetical protein